MFGDVSMCFPFLAFYSDQYFWESGICICINSGWQIPWNLFLVQFGCSQAELQRGLESNISLLLSLNVSSHLVPFQQLCCSAATFKDCSGVFKAFVDFQQIQQVITLMEGAWG